MRRVAHITFVLAVAVAGFAVPGSAPAGEAGVGLERQRITFTVNNPQEQGAERTVVGYRYDPACEASTVVLLQHGLSYTKEAWDFPGYSVAQPLAEAGYAVVAIDRLGYHESVLENGYDISQEAYAHITDQIVGQLRSEFDHVVLGGHSAGGGVTALTQGSFGSGDAIMVLGWHHRPSDEIFTEFMSGDTARALQDDYEYFLENPEHRADMFFTAAADPGVVEEDKARAVLTPSGEVLTISKQPSRYVANRVRVPVFLQLSEFDRIFEPEYAEFDAAHYASAPSVTIDMVPDAGHTFMLHPSGRDATARLVEWVSTTSGTPACSS